MKVVPRAMSVAVLVVVALVIAGCGGGAPGFQMTPQQNLEAGRTQLDAVFTALSDGNDVDPSAIAEASSHFEAAMTGVFNLSEAAFGSAITGVASSAASVKEGFQSRGPDMTPRAVRVLTDGAMIWNLSSAIHGEDNVLDQMGGAAIELLRALRIERAAGAPQDDVLARQTQLRNLATAIDAALPKLAIAEQDANFTFRIGPANGEHVIVDRGDILLYDGVLRAVRAAIIPLISYSADTGSFPQEVDLTKPALLDANSDGVLTPGEYLPPDPFLTLTDEPGMSGINDTLAPFVNKIIAGVDATVLETADEHELIPWHGPDAVMTSDELRQLKTTAQALKDGIAAGEPRAVAVDINGDGATDTTVNVNLRAWIDNPPVDLKVFAPILTIVVTGEVTDLVQGDLLDETFGGLLPDGPPEGLL